MHTIWIKVFYQPLYNALIFIASVMPLHDIGIAIILLTILVKLILFPISKRSIVSQMKLKALEGELARIKQEFPNKEEQAKKTFELYKVNKVNPFSGCLLILIQMPIIFALFYVMRSVTTDVALLYPFIKMPGNLHTEFLGLIDLAKPSIVFAILAGVSQFIQMKIANPFPKPTEATKNDKSFQGQFQKSMQTQMQYVLPVMIIFLGLKISAAVALYWVTSNILAIAQEYALRKKKMSLLVK